jgi:hypothetical protein
MKKQSLDKGFPQGYALPVHRQLEFVTILKYPCHESGLIPLGCKIAGVADCQNGEVSLGLKLRRFFL